MKLDILPDTKNKVVIILSGGLDSTTLMRTLVEKYGHDNVLAISFNYGQRQSIELEKAKQSTSYLNVNHEVFNLSILGEIAQGFSANVDRNMKMPSIKEVLGDPSPKTEVPFRNMIMLSLASSYAQVNNCDFIFIGLQSNDLYNYWDTTERFVHKLNDVLSENRIKKIQIISPFVNITKKEEISWLVNELKDPELLKFTITCYNPNNEGKSCGKCPSCSERKKAFIDLNMDDVIEYQ